MSTLILHRCKDVVGLHSDKLIPDTDLYAVHGNLDNGQCERMIGRSYENIIVLPGVVIGNATQRIVDRILSQTCKLHTKVTYHESNTMQRMS